MAGFERGVRPIGRLVDVDHLVEHLDAFDVHVVARLDAHLVEPVRERLVDDLVDERRLARARDPGDADELPDRELDVDPLQVVLRGAADGEDTTIVLAPRRDRDRTTAREEVTGHRALRPHHLLGGSLGDDVPSVLAGTRAHVDDPVGDPHHLLVVLDDEHRVPERLQPLQRRDQAVVVALVETDRRLVEDVEHADELRADLCREPQPLRLAARQRLCGTVELEIADADIGEERESLPDLLHDPVPDQLLGRSEVELVEEPQGAGDREPGERVDRQVADRDRQHCRLETRATAVRAGPEAHVLLDPLALLTRFGFAIAALEIANDALERHRVLPPAPHPVLVLNEDPVAVRPEEEPVLLLFGEVPPRQVDVDLVAVGDRLDDALVEARAPDRPGHERTVRDRDATCRERACPGRSRAAHRARCTAGRPRAAH